MNSLIDKKTTSPIAKRLKEARLLSGLSQKKLGIAAGIDEFSSSARMNQYEKGKHTPDFSMLARIAKVLRLPTAFFYTNENNLAEVIRLYHALNESQKRKALLFIKKQSARF